MQNVTVTLRRIPTLNDLKLVGFSGSNSAEKYAEDIDLINREIMPFCDGKQICQLEVAHKHGQISCSAVIWIDNWYLPAYLFNVKMLEA
jgi:hypothetical protein